MGERIFFDPQKKAERMKIHVKTHDTSGAGKWDIHTTRYVPVGGGARSMLPVYDDPDYRRYHGFVGIDEHLTEAIHLLPVLFQYMGGKAIIQAGEFGKFTAQLLGETTERLEAKVERKKVKEEEVEEE